jgi:hypothetical protein
MTTLSRSHLLNQRQQLVDGPEIGLRDEDFIIPVQLPANDRPPLEDNREDDNGSGYWIEDTVMPEQSVTSRGMLKRKDKAYVCEREMAELRRLVQSDDRFGRSLEKTCEAVYECISVGNPSPVLALLASLVWRSLCIIWELEPKSGMPKSHLRSKIEGLEGVHQTVVHSFDGARAKYLKELVSLRDQIRRLDKKALVEISKLVYQEDPVMYYEPLQYLGEAERQHVAEIVEEKMKLLFSRLKAPDATEDSETSATDNARADANAREAADARALYDSSQKRVAQLEEELQTLRASRGNVEQEMDKLMNAAQEEYEELAPILGRESVREELAPMRGRRSILFQSASGSPCPTLQPPPAFVRQSARQPTTMDAANVDSQPPRPPSKQNIIQSSPTLNSSPTPLLPSGQPTSKSARSWNHCLEYVTDLVQTERHARKALQVQLAEVQSGKSAEDAAAKARMEAVRSREQADAAKVAEAAERERKLLEASAEHERARTKAEERARVLELELAKLQLELKRAKAQSEDTELKSEMERELMEAKKTIKELSEELQRLRAMIAELTSGDVHKDKLKSQHLCWRMPTGKVFERLFQDATDRRERQRNLIASLEQARDEQALEIFKSSLLQFSSYDVPAYSEFADGFEDASWCPGVWKGPATGWVMDRSRKAVLEEPAPDLCVDSAVGEQTCPPGTVSFRPSDALRKHAEMIRDSISATVAADLGTESRAAARRTASPAAPAGQSDSSKSPRSRSPHENQGGEAQDAQGDMKVEGKHLGPIPEQNATTAEKIAAERADFADFAASLGLACPSNLPIQQAVAAAPVRRYAPSPAASRPTSAQIIRRARSNVVARPKSAGLPAITRIHRPQSETALAREAQRILNQTNPTPVPAVAPQAEVQAGSKALWRTNSAPALRARGSKSGMR